MSSLVRRLFNTIPVAMAQWGPRLVGRRVVSGRGPRPTLWKIAFQTTVLASDIDPGAGVAAVWMRRYGLRGRSAEHVWLYERIGQRWEPVGGGSSEAAPLAGRSQVAGVLDIINGGGVRSLADRERRPDPGSFTYVGWVAYTLFLAGPRAGVLLAGSRRIAVPAHGYCVVVWKGPPADDPAGRPRITVVGRDGTVLGELGTRDRWDTEFVARLAEELRD